MTRYESVLDAVGGTPLIRLVRTGLRPRIYVKPEWYNPGASSKDRAALAMLRRAEADGSLRPGGTVVETTSGNTGIGLALYAAVLGYRAVLFTSSAVSREKRDLLRAYGAEVRLVDAFVPRSHPDSLRSTAERFVAATPGAWLADQYDNPANPDAHYRTTGPEIWADTDGGVTWFVATVGTGGTITGTARYLKEVSGGRVQVVGAEPYTSAYGGGDGSQKDIEGAGHFVHPDAEVDVWPASFDPSLVDRYVRVRDHDAIGALHRLARTEGLLAGGSSGVALVAALEVARDLTEDDTVVVLLPDSGRAYLSTYFDPAWLRDRGYRDEDDGAVGARGADGVRGADGTDLAPDASDASDAARDAAPRVRDALAPLGPLVDAVSPVAEALAHLERSGARAHDPVVVVRARPRRDLPPHPAEVVGWTTPAALHGVAADGGSAWARDAAEGGLPRLGAGATVATALAQAGASHPGWEAGLVLEDGRVVGVVRRAELERVAGR